MGSTRSVGSTTINNIFIHDHKNESIGTYQDTLMDIFSQQMPKKINSRLVHCQRILLAENSLMKNVG